MYKNLEFNVQNGVAWATINRPTQLNALDLDTAKELEHIANRCSHDASVRVVVLGGAGERAFCSGGDVCSFASCPERIDALIREITTHLHGAISLFVGMSVPVIAAVNGVTAGAGLGLMSCADIAIAAESAKFTSAYSKIGLTPDGSTSYFLVRLLGRG